MAGSLFDLFNICARSLTCRFLPAAFSQILAWQVEKRACMASLRSDGLELYECVLYSLD